MKRIMIATALLLSFAASAQNKGGISPEMLGVIREGYKGTSFDKAVKNALNTTPIEVLSQNMDVIGKMDDKFSDRVETVGITNQNSSGRCWLFSGLNVLRARTIKEHDLGDFQFSQNYVFFFDQLEKANLFLQGVIDTRDLGFDDRKVDWLFANPMSDGGQFTGVSNLVTKYGLVPSEIMPESYCANNTSTWTRHFKNLLRQDGLRLREGKKTDRQLQDMKTEMLSEVYRLLCLTLGVPPTEFEWKGEHYTPKSFAEKYAESGLNDNFVMIMNDPTRPYYTSYEIDYDRHLYDGQNWLYINLPLDEIKKMAIASIKDNTAMYFSCDVGKFLDRKKGVMDINNFDYDDLLGIEFNMDKAERIRTHASGSSHAMTLIAVDLKDGVPQKWMVENSWGGDNGFKGNYVMTDEWFDNYMFRLVVNRKYVPEDILSILKKKPTLLPAWDPMFLPEE